MNLRQREFQWYIHYKCNYRCPFCYFLKERLKLMKKDVYLSVKEWTKYWNRIYSRYGSVQIHLTGGEPSVYPSFIELVKELSAQHTFKISTNLSGDFKLFSQKINPDRVKGGICASFTPLVDFPVFLNKAITLKNRGFPIYIVYVAYPPQIKQMRHYINMFKKEGFKKFVILPYRGNCKGVSYPDWYSKEDRAIIWEVAEELGQDGSIKDFKYQISREPQPKGSSEEKKESDNAGRKNPKGKLCRAGQFYAVVDSDGKVTRCGEKGSKYLGSFFDDNFRLLDSPLPCDNSSCNCEFTYLVEEEKRKVNDRLPPPHKVFFNWDIHYSCNYRCDYCFLEGQWDEICKGNTYPGIDKWVDIWTKIYDKYGSCQIDISGGEPSIYPSFIELVAALSSMHDIKFNTNLSLDVTAFVKGLAPIVNRRGQRAMVINSSFKPDKVGLEEFLKKVLFLKSKGFKISVTYVAYPPHMKRMCEFKNRFEENKIEFIIQPFRGKYQDKIYPKQYSEGEKKIFKECYNGNPPPLVSYFVEDDLQKKKGLCRMGQVYAKIYPNGETYRCCAQDSGRLGNIIKEKDFSLLKEPAYCDLPCPCWKAMVVGQESQWLPNWASS